MGLPARSLPMQSDWQSLPVPATPASPEQLSTEANIKMKMVSNILVYFQHTNVHNMQHTACSPLASYLASYTLALLLAALDDSSSSVQTEEEEE